MNELALNGGTPVRSNPYPAWPSGDDREIDAVADVIRSGDWGGYPEPGRYGGRFETAFAEYQGAKHGVLMANGTITMEVALKALGIGWGDEVIIPALTFAATAYAPIAAGALPVIVDVTPDTWCIDPDLVEAAITPKTKAIMPVHLGHHMADMDRIMAIATNHGLAVVEDCAHAHGQQWQGTGAGCIGDFGSFSHQSSKILTSGEGGSLLTSDDDLAQRAHSLIDCGRAKDADEKEYTFGANYRLGELHAALLVVAMERFPAQQAERAESGKLFEELVAQVQRRSHDAGRSARHALVVLQLHPGDRPGCVRRSHQRDRLRGIGGRGHPRRGAVPVDEPTTSSSSPRSRAYRSVWSSPIGWIRRRCRSRWPRPPASASRCTSWRTSSATGRKASRTPWRPSRRSSGTRPSCRRDRRGPRQLAAKNRGR